LEQRNYNALIEVITTDNDKTLDLLPERWQKSIRHWQQESAKKPADADLRERLIIEAELLAGLDSPASSEALRQQLRLALLQAHMNGGSSQTVESLFWQWLEAGAVNVEDKSALQRFQRALTANIS
jgi:DNA gyrase inhibitor GyrI